jgi:hypothetical protein
MLNRPTSSTNKASTAWLSALAVACGLGVMRLKTDAYWTSITCYEHQINNHFQARAPFRKNEGRLRRSKTMVQPVSCNASFTCCEKDRFG